MVGLVSQENTGINITDVDQEDEFAILKLLE